VTSHYAVSFQDWHGLTLGRELRIKLTKSQIDRISATGSQPKDRSVSVEHLAKGPHPIGNGSFEGRVTFIFDLGNKGSELIQLDLRPTDFGVIALQMIGADKDAALEAFGKAIISLSKR